MVENKKVNGWHSLLWVLFYELVVFLIFDVFKINVEDIYKNRFSFFNPRPLPAFKLMLMICFPVIVFFVPSKITLALNSFFFHSEGVFINNIAKAILIGIFAGLLIGLTGENWNFEVHPYEYYPGELFDYFGKTQAIIGGAIVSLALFLKYNKKH